MAWILTLAAVPYAAAAHPQGDPTDVAVERLAQHPGTPAAPQAPERPPAPTATECVPPAPGTPTADQIAQRIQAFYDRTTDFQADFVQVSHNRLYNRDERRSGHVIFLKPGRMRWNYNQPAGDVIVSDGTTIVAYQADDHQALQQPLAQSQLPTALTFLAGTGRITDAFTFCLLDAGHYHFPTGYVLELRPTQPSPAYERIVFYVDRASYQVERTVVFNAQGDHNRFDFLSPQVNLHPAQTTFHWTPPPGTTMIHP